MVSSFHFCPEISPPVANGHRSGHGHVQRTSAQVVHIEAKGHHGAFSQFEAWQRRELLGELGEKMG